MRAVDHWRTKTRARVIAIAAMQTARVTAKTVTRERLRPTFFSLSRSGVESERVGGDVGDGVDVLWC